MKKYLLFLLTFLIILPSFSAQYNADAERRLNEHYENGVTFLKSSKYASAILEFKKVLRNRPYDAKVKNALVSAYYSRANFYATQDAQPLKAIVDLKSALYYLRYWNGDQITSEQTNQAASFLKSLNQLEADTKRISTPAQRFESAKTLRTQGELAAAGYDFAQLFNDKTYFVKARESAGDIYKTLNNEYDAMNCYREVLRVDPKNASVHFKYAQILENANNLDAAGEQYNLALKYGEKNPELLDKLEHLWLSRSLNNPDDSQALINLGTILQKKGDLENAQIQYKKAQALDPNDETVTLNLASLYIQGNQFGEAIKIYDEMLRKKPDDIQVLTYKADAYEKLKDYKNAVKVYEKILSLEGNNKTALSAIDDIVTNNFQGDDLYSYLKTQADKKPDDFKSQYEYAYQMHKAGHLKDAENYYSRALEINPKSVDCYINLSQIYLSKEDTKNARVYVERGLEISPDEKTLLSFKDSIVKSDSVDLYNKATELFKDKKYKEALETYQKIPFETPELNEAIASCYIELEDYNSAISKYKRVLEKDSDNTGIMYQIANSYLELGNDKEARVYLNKILEIEPENGAVKNALYSIEQTNISNFLNDAISFYEKKDFSHAMTTLDKVIALDHENAYAFYYKGVIYDEQNKNKEAIEQFKKVISFNPDFNLAYYSLAGVFDKQEKYEEAVSNYDKFLELKKKLGEDDDEYYKYVEARNNELKAYLTNKS